MDDREQRLIDDITAARDEVLRTASALTDEQAERPSANEGWTVKDTLAHLASIEARQRAQWQAALEGRAWPAEDASVHAYNERCVAERRSRTFQQLVDELRQSGRETQQFLERLGPTDLDRTWTHPTRGLVTIQTLVEIVPRHLREHGEEIRAATNA